MRRKAEKDGVCRDRTAIRPEPKLASFPAGLVIYWAWNNTLSVPHQSIIMRKHGAKIELFDNIKGLFGKKKPQS